MDEIEDLPVGWEKESSNADLPDKAGSQPVSVHDKNLHIQSVLTQETANTRRTYSDGNYKPEAKEETV